MISGSQMLKMSCKDFEIWQHFFYCFFARAQTQWNPICRIPQWLSSTAVKQIKSLVTEDVLADGKWGFGFPEGEEDVFSMLPLFCAHHRRRRLWTNKEKKNNKNMNMIARDFIFWGVGSGVVFSSATQTSPKGGVTCTWLKSVQSRLAITDRQCHRRMQPREDVYRYSQTAHGQTHLSQYGVLLKSFEATSTQSWNKEALIAVEFRFHNVHQWGSRDITQHHLYRSQEQVIKLKKQ